MSIKKISQENREYHVSFKSLSSGHRRSSLHLKPLTQHTYRSRNSYRSSLLSKLLNPVSIISSNAAMIMVKVTQKTVLQYIFKSPKLTQVRNKSQHMRGAAETKAGRYLDNKPKLTAQH